MPPPVGSCWKHIAVPSFDNSTPLKMHAQQNPMFGLENPRQTGYNAYGATMFAVLSALITRTGPQGGANTLRPAAYMFPLTILTDNRKNCNSLFPIFAEKGYCCFFRHIPDLLCFHRLSGFLRFDGDFSGRRYEMLRF